MTEDPKKTSKPTQKIDLDLGGLLGNLGEVLGEAVQRLTEVGEAAVDKINETKGDTGPIRTHTGLRVRVGGLSTRPAKGTAPAKPTPANPTPVNPTPVNPDRQKAENPKARPLHCDLLEDGDLWVVTAEMPGVGPEEVRISASGTKLTIETTGARHYLGSVDLPVACAADGISRHLVNGILTLRPGGPA